MADVRQIRQLVGSPVVETWHGCLLARRSSVEVRDLLARDRHRVRPQELLVVRCEEELAASRVALDDRLCVDDPRLLGRHLEGPVSRNRWLKFGHDQVSLETTSGAGAGILT